MWLNFRLLRGFYDFPSKRYCDRSILPRSQARFSDPSTLWRKQKMKDFNKKDNDRVASGLSITLLSNAENQQMGSPSYFEGDL